MSDSRPTIGRVADATPVSQTLYGVTYPGHADCDSNVPYAYLRRLARDGYIVRVGGGHGVEPHTMHPGD